MQQAGVRQHGLSLLACHPATLCANIKGLRCKRPGKHAAFPCMIMEKRHNGRPLVQRHIRGLIKGEFPACRVAGLHQLRLQTEGICLMSERLGLWPAAQRSEEHTSELQSLMRNSYAVFCLKKKKNNISKLTQHKT